MAHAKASKIETYLPLITQQFRTGNISKPLRQAHFLAQIGHESLSLMYAEEIATGAAYEGRKDLGNINPGDGVRFKGRGLIQLTGRANYERFADSACIDLYTPGKEKLISTPYYALQSSIWYWHKTNLNIRADADDIRGITKSINGSYNGLSDRIDYLFRAKFFLIP
jgi:putative chitinase